MQTPIFKKEWCNISTLWHPLIHSVSSTCTINWRHCTESMTHRLVGEYFFLKYTRELHIFVLRRKTCQKVRETEPGQSLGTKQQPIETTRWATPDAKLLRCLAPTDAHKSACALMTCSSWGTVLDAYLKHLAFLSFHNSQLVRAKRESRPRRLFGVVARRRRRHHWRTERADGGRMMLMAWQMKNQTSLANGHS
jgi:hypothetical protein